MANRRKRANGRNGHDVQERLNALRADLDALQGDLRGLVSDVRTGAVEGAKHYVQETAESIEDWGDENLDTVRVAVRTQPLAACMLSMSAGALLGALLLRR